MTTTRTAPRPGKLTSYARLAKLDVFDYHLAVPLAWSLLQPAERFVPATFATLLLFALGSVCVLSAGVALDDVTGYRDGSDAANYGPDAPARRLARKPLLTGALTEADALRFAKFAGVAGALAWGGAIAVAPVTPLWAVVAVVVCYLMSLQYSYGLRLSYRGAQELVLAGYGAGLVLAAGGLCGGSGTLFTVEAVLFGLGPLLFGVYSNTNDSEGDAAVSRRTVAATVSRQANATFIKTVTAVEFVVILGAPLLAGVPWWFPLVLLPSMVLRAGQLKTGVGLGHVLKARRLGIRAHRFTAVVLMMANVYFFLGIAL